MEQLSARIHDDEGGIDDAPAAVTASIPGFAEGVYLTAYPDVVTLIGARQFASGVQHWLSVGKREFGAGTRIAPLDFDEAAYLVRRPDVGAAVARGEVVSGFDHWLEWGWTEAKGGQARLDALLTRASAFDDTVRHKAYADSLPGEKAAFWAENGYMILEGAIDDARCIAISRRVDRLWAERHEQTPPVSIDIFVEQPHSRRIPMQDAPDDARGVPYKINDLFLFDDAVRDVALDDGVVDALRWVLNDDPAIIGSLNFERGSTQRFHTDTLFMPGKTAGGMTAAWFALEDVRPEAGPLLYYPGSHKIPLFLFSTMRPTVVDGEYSDYDAFMSWNVEQRRLVPAQFLPKRGDALIWHERLFHGGAAIQDNAMTRKSLVIHYWRADELVRDELVAWGNGFYWNRPPMR